MAPLHLRVFLSSPGDVPKERRIGRKLLRDVLAVDPFIRNRATFDVVSWDDPHASAAMPAHLTPQEAVNLGLPRPSECDIVVVILRSKIGTKLPSAFRKKSGRRYRSGTEWEYEDALAAARQTGRPTILVYRGAPLSKSSRAKDASRFFSRFRNSDGSPAGSFCRFTTPDDFRRLLNQHLRAVVHRLLDPAPALSTSAAAPAFQSRIEAFLDEYLKSEVGPVPFAGRDTELDMLDAWLDDRHGVSRFLVTAPAGRGKSALLVRWMDRLQRRGVIAADRWRLVFVPISIRFSTNRQQDFYEALAGRLAEVAGRTLQPPATDPAGFYRDKTRDLLKELAASSQSVLVVIDGLDEAHRGEFDGTIFPRVLPPSIRILLSARWHVGDIDSSGWRGRLDWSPDLNVRTYEVKTLDTTAIGDVLVSMGAPLRILSSKRTLLTRLKELTDGEPLLVRLYAIELWQKRDDIPHLTRSDLDNLKPGFGPYFDRWIEHQENAWHEAGEPIDRTDVDAIMAVLAFAQGPLQAKDLFDLVSGLTFGRVLSMQGLLKPLRRFVIGDGTPERGYVLSHPKIGEHLKLSRFIHIAATVERLFADWGRSVVAALSEERLRPEDTPPYLLLFHRRHLEAVEAGLDDYLALASNGWRRGWEHYEGDARGFAVDVRAALDAIRRRGTLAHVGDQVRCVLILSSIRSLGQHVPGELILAAVRKDAMSVRQACHLARFIADEVEHVTILAAITAEFEKDAARREGLLAEAWGTARTLADEDDKARAMWAVFARMPAEQRHEVFDEVFRASKAVDDKETRARILADGAPHVPGDLRQKVLDAGLAATRGIARESDRVWALSNLAKHLPREQLRRAMRIAYRIRNEWCRAHALADLALLLPDEARGPVVKRALADINLIRFDHWSGSTDALYSLASHLSREQIDAALVTAIATCTVQALDALAPHLSTGQLSKGLAAAKAITDDDLRITALAALLPHLRKAQRPEIVATAFAAGSTIDREWVRGRAFGNLAEFLSGGQLDAALESTRIMKDEGSRMTTLGYLAPYLSNRQLTEALEIAKTIGDSEDRAIALSLLTSASQQRSGVPNPEPAESPDPKTVAEKLAAARRSGNAKGIASALIQLARAASGSELQGIVDEALEVLEYVAPDGLRAHMLGALAPHLSVEQADGAVAMAEALYDEWDRVKALQGLAPRVSEAMRPRVLSEGLRLALAIRSVDARARALAALVWHQLPSDAQSGLVELLKIADRLTRPVLLTTMSKFAPVIADVGGPDALPACLRAIRDTAAWYP
jgi:hypothetical protein